MYHFKTLSFNFMLLFSSTINLCLGKAQFLLSMLRSKYEIRKKKVSSLFVGEKVIFDNNKNTVTVTGL
jgi:hypothetical protein